MGQCQLWQTLYMVQRLTILRAVCKGWEANCQYHTPFSLVLGHRHYSRR